MNVVTHRARAKINLTLEVVGEAGGYHLLRSLVLSIDLNDKVVARRRTDGRVLVRMRGMGSERIPEDKNNAVRAARAFMARFSCAGADIFIKKRIPIGAGLGGSSADVAGVLRALATLYGVQDEGALKEIADSLGSDTGYMLRGGAALLSGRGEVVQPLSDVPKLHFLLLLPKEGVSTAACYKLCTAHSRGEHTEAACRALVAGDIEGACKHFENHLLAPACSLNGDIARALALARSLSPLHAGMTGSGSCVFALFPTKRAARAAQKKCKGRFRTLVATSIT